MLDERSIMKLEKYFERASNTFLKKRTLREYTNNLCEYLELPKLRIIIVTSKDFSHEEGIDILAYFSVNCDNRPYMVFYKKGMRRLYVKHEIIHYIQFLQDGLESFVDPELDLEHEMEAEMLQEYSEKDLKLRIPIRNLVQIFKQQD